MLAIAFPFVVTLPVVFWIRKNFRVTFCKVQPTSDTEFLKLSFVFTYFGPYMVLNFTAIFFFFFLILICSSRFTDVESSTGF